MIYNAANDECRAGFTALELLACVMIVGALASLLLPAVLVSREAARSVECKSRLRDLALAITNMDSSNDRLPASGVYSDELIGGTRFSEPYYSWRVEALPFIGQQNLYDSWDFSYPQSSAANLAANSTRVLSFVCPSDPTLSSNRNPRGDSSYIVNGGVGYTGVFDEVKDCPLSWGDQPVDLLGRGSVCLDSERDPETRKLYESMGLFFMENTGGGETSRHHALADVSDGTSQTIMLSESTTVGFERADHGSGFSSPKPFHTSFFIHPPCIDPSACRGVLPFENATSGRFAIGSFGDFSEGASGGPNSAHRGIVNFAYADGHVSSIPKRSIDAGVYAALVSPQGVRLSGKLSQPVVSSSY